MDLFNYMVVLETAIMHHANVDFLEQKHLNYPYIIILIIGQVIHCLYLFMGKRYNNDLYRFKIGIYNLNANEQNIKIYLKDNGLNENSKLISIMNINLIKAGNYVANASYNNGEYIDCYTDRAVGFSTTFLWVVLI